MRIRYRSSFKRCVLIYLKSWSWCFIKSVLSRFSSRKL